MKLGAIPLIGTVESSQFNWFGHVCRTETEDNLEERGKQNRKEKEEKEYPD